MHLRRALAVGSAALAMAGCSGEAAVNKVPRTGTGVASEVDGIQQITVRSGLDLRFHPSTIVVHSGTVRILLVNTAKPGEGPPHNIQMSGLPAADVPDTQAGDTRSVTFTAPAPGTYTFVCTIHAAQGQSGTLIVK
jgi:plastocyanin